MLWIVYPWRPSFVISRTHLRPMLRFGLGIVAVGLLGQGANNFDYLVVGAKLGAVALGVYYLAFRLPELVILSGFQVANDVLFPFYARLKEGEVDGIGRPAPRLSGDGSARVDGRVSRRLRDGRAGPAAGPDPLRRALARAAAEPLALVSIWAGLASLASMPGAVFKALGRSWLLTATGLMQIAILFPAVWFAADYSITAVAAAQVLEKTVSLALLGVVIGRILSIPWYATFAAGAPALALSVTMAAVLYPLSTVLPAGAGGRGRDSAGRARLRDAAAGCDAARLPDAHPSAGRRPLDGGGCPHSGPGTAVAASWPSHPRAAPACRSVSRRATRRSTGRSSSRPDGRDAGPGSRRAAVRDARARAEEAACR